MSVYVGKVIIERKWKMFTIGLKHIMESRGAKKKSWGNNI